MSNPGKTSLISWWSLDEESGTRNDSHGTNHLADNNTVLYAAGKQGNAADLESGNSEYLSIASNASLATGDIDFTFACWVNFESLETGRTVAGKWKLGPGGREWVLVYESPNIQFLVSSTGANTVALSGGTPSTATWYYYVCWHDATANTINFQINNGTPASASHTAGVFNSGSRLLFGDIVTNLDVPLSGYYHDGLIDEACFWKRVLTEDERTWLYNSGNGRTYSELLAGQVSVGGTLTSAGVLIKQTGKPLAGTLTSAGVVVKSTARALAGALTSAGAVVKSTARALAGAMTSAGTVVKSTAKSLAGTLTSAGTLATVFQGVITALTALTARARLFALDARERLFSLTARDR